MNPALWRGWQIIKRCYEMVPTSLKLIIKLCTGALDSAKAGFHLPHTWPGSGVQATVHLIPLPLPHISLEPSSLLILSPSLSPQRSNPLRVWNIPLHVTDILSYDNVKSTHHPVPHP